MSNSQRPKTQPPASLPMLEWKWRKDPPRPLHRDHKRVLRALGSNIKAARTEAGISMGTMAKLSGVSKGNCSKIERGANITTLALYKLCWVLGVHPREVLPDFLPSRFKRP